jgi:hypothetical protein
MCDIFKKVAFTSKVMKNSQLMDYMVSLHFIDFISWGVSDNGPLYCITLCHMPCSEPGCSSYTHTLEIVVISDYGH